jgi:hypothetical protein
MTTLPSHGLAGGCHRARQEREPHLLRMGSVLAIPATRAETDFVIHQKESYSGFRHLSRSPFDAGAGVRTTRSTTKITMTTLRSPGLAGGAVLAVT